METIIKNVMRRSDVGINDKAALARSLANNTVFSGKVGMDLLFSKTGQAFVRYIVW